MLIVVCAMKEEAREIIKYFNLQKKAGYFESEKIRLIITGIGREKVREVLSKAQTEGIFAKDDDILNFGFAGGHKIKTGMVIAIREVFLKDPYENPAGFGLDCPVGFYPSGTVDCYTSDTFVERCEYRSPCVFDMELFEICIFPHRKIYSIKLVSDNLSEAEFDSKIGEYSLDLVLSRIEKILERTD